ncbi:protein POLAR-like 1 [Phragmites australis]|uniref:protein POLAR-like 1 n=1 Tax=Phragmites australis TaxID=29695 RepID=UPI002D77140C|nr:protein POLAR-like 1 [Phragmites australis]
MASDGRIRTRRIVDYLNDGEELGVDGTVGTPPRSPAAARSVLPRFRWARLVRLGRKDGGGNGKEEELVVAEKGELPPVVVSTSERESATTSDPKHSDLGVGLSLVFLLAKTSDEFNKMVKVRTEMEELLKEIKDEVRSKSSIDGHDVSKALNRESITSSCVTDGNDHRASGHLEDQAASSSMEAASCEKSYEDDGCCARMDVLEEEFHAELEQLQVNYGSDTPFLPEEEHDTEPSDDTADYRHGVNDDDLGDVADDEEDNDDDETEYNGVSAVELERRLHELLHERNRDRIEELEAALQRTEKKLVEKEMEVRLWKDTAKFALRQDKNNELH